MPFHFESTLPSWMTYIAGELPLVFVAPHGGRRPADAPILDSIKVNDLHTADLTAELADFTNGYAFINHAQDRNELDLNRISQVRHRAPWFLSALVELLSALVEQHGAARIFFIHGWNVVQSVCDLGMGLKLRGGKIVPVGKAAPTLSPQFLAGEVLPFREAAVEQGIDVAIGRRYPAADKNNVMQLFSGRFAEDSSPAVQRLAQLCTTGKVNAVQCELGVGLRWPGAERERFVEVFCQTLGKPPHLAREQEREFATVSIPVLRAAATSHQNGALLPLRHQAESRRFGLHFHDPVSGLGLMGGIENSPSSHTHSGRLMLSLGGTEMVLFTGEDESVADPHQLRVGGLLWQSHPDGLAIAYRGSVMRFSHPQAFIRLEAGLAASWVEPAEISLYLTLPCPLPDPPAPLFLAHLRGEVCLRDRRHTLDAWGFLDMLKSEESGRLQPRRLLSLPFGPDLGIFLSWVETENGPRSSGIIYHHGVPHAVQQEEWDLQYTFVDGRPSTFRLSVMSAAIQTMHCTGETLTAIPIVRHAAEGSALAVTFGLSRTVWQGREARGIYEYSERRKD
ncbi:MAG: hypothetical protein AB7G75_03915 [Candidatus Binatia bacterium]